MRLQVGAFHRQRRPRLSILLIRLVFLLESVLVEGLKFSEELLLPEELASEDVLRRYALKSAAPTISSSRTSQSGEVVW